MVGLVAVVLLMEVLPVMDANVAAAIGDIWQLEIQGRMVDRATTTYSMNAGPGGSSVFGGGGNAPAWTSGNSVVGGAGQAYGGGGSGAFCYDANVQQGWWCRCSWRCDYHGISLKVV